MKTKEHKFFPYANLFYSIMCSTAIALLLVLAPWRFELRSISRFLLITAPVSAVIFALSYFLYFRKLPLAPSFPPLQTFLNGTTSLLLTLHLVPPQVSMIRYSIVFLLTTASLFLINQTLLFNFLKRKNFKMHRVLPAVTILFCIVNLGVIIYNAQYVRIYGDDFANVLKLERLGMWGAGILFYNTWSGRFFSNFLVMGFSDKPWAPLVFLLLIQIILFFVMRQLLGSKNSVFAFAFSLFIPLTIYTVTPDMYKSLYWNASAMTLLPLLVMVPLYLFTLYQAARNRSFNTIFLTVMAALLSFTITTCHEAAAIGWAGVHIIGLVWSWQSGLKHKRLNILLWTGFFAAAAGLAMMLLSPGASARYAEQEYVAGTDIPTLLLNTIHFFFGFIRDISRPIYVYHGFIRPGWLLLSGLFGFAWLLESPLERSFRSALFILVISLMMVLAAFIPGAVILGDTIPYRTQFIPTMYLALGIFIFGLLLPHPKDQGYETTLTFLTLFMVLAGTFFSLTQLFQTIGPMRQYARDWDARDELVRTTDAIPRRLTVPWDEYEQNLGDFRKYYRSRE